ncbi:mycofactocin biosynthesis peptidyl-dipeptidase MftE [Pimelobacter simplex]|uniref:mycofactocin biosynthesis peptidyl-dipeptidase MftE n=1 Tax=Nocardioides simplex TaxID=2045 RepID=UPI00215044F0|nr:mycofactocin biosynthesis peptidyl-dipeptidase MftE [Pimelobacter simplex]UUW90453.1 mycofactocin biosynthesis peptidyl-dipeptidase MftE [Pimelobacter simplex]UUW94283.1 mycofactocin biosynthesis peptidyl-dipeptidase MftE [Pimelobacter simplex]
MERALAAATSPGLPAGATVLVPVGSIEQHGPHLPLDTDTVIATAVATEAARLLALRDYDVLVAPALSYGSSGEHQDFAGTSSIGTDVLHQVVVELTRSMRTWAARVVLVSAHGGNLTALRGAVRQLADEGHDVSWVACATEDVDLHAGRTETSLMLHLAPWNVRVDRAEAGNTGTIEELLPAMIAGGVKAVSPNGVLGDPAGASAEEGAVVLASMVGDVVRAVGGS